MKFLDRIKKGINPDDDDDFSDEFNGDEMYYDSSDGETGNQGDMDFMASGGYSSPYGTGTGAGNQSQQNNQGGYSSNSNSQYQQSAQTQHSSNSSGITVSSNSSSGAGRGGNVQLSAELIIVKPENCQSVNQIAEHLLNGKTVVLNLEETSKETARRLIDYLAGVAYAINGQLQKVSDRNFVIAPSNTAVSSDQIQAKEESRKSSSSDDSIY